MIERGASERQRHKCDWQDKAFESRKYDHAVLFCYEDTDGTLWVSNNEYCSQVNYCPFCGYKANV